MKHWFRLYKLINFDFFVFFSVSFSSMLVCKLVNKLEAREGAGSLLNRTAV